MMKLSLAILAVGAAATQTRSSDWDCYGEWYWEDCSGLYWQSDYCTDDCGWWYSPGLDDDWSDDWWVTCDEFDSWAECNGDSWTDDWGDDCYGEWNWEECSGLYWQSDWCTDDCGWWYSPGLDDDWSDDWWVTCDDFWSWESCNGGDSWTDDWSDDGCYGEWYWEDCSGLYWQSDYCTDDCGWWYSPGLDDDWSDDWWVTCDDFYSWEYC